MHSPIHLLAMVIFRLGSQLPDSPSLPGRPYQMQSTHLHAPSAGMLPCCRHSAARLLRPHWTKSAVKTITAASHDTVSSSETVSVLAFVCLCNNAVQRRLTMLSGAQVHGTVAQEARPQQREQWLEDLASTLEEDVSRHCNCWFCCPQSVSCLRLECIQAAAC